MKRHFEFHTGRGDLARTSHHEVGAACFSEKSDEFSDSEAKFQRQGGAHVICDSWSAFRPSSGHTCRGFSAGIFDMRGREERSDS